MEMHIVTPHWERTLAMTIWSKGMDKTFIRITAPKKEQGGRNVAYRERDVELSPQDEQSYEDSAINDDGIVDGFRFHE